MLRYLIVFLLLLAALIWIEPWLRSINAVEAVLHPWLPVLSPEVWSAVMMVTVGLAGLLGLLLLFKFGLFVWRELND